MKGKNVLKKEFCAKSDEKMGHQMEENEKRTKVDSV